ncbi:MAG: hypothetical protein ACFCU9_14200 [Cyanophyceae cyanobacterium]
MNDNGTNGSNQSPSSSSPPGFSVPGVTHRRFLPLHQVVAKLDLDALQELDRFRTWQQTQQQKPVTEAPKLTAEEAAESVPPSNSGDNPLKSRENGFDPFRLDPSEEEQLASLSDSMASAQPVLTHLSPSLLPSMPRPASSSRSAYLQPHDVVEDLELEERRGIPGLISPILVLLLWAGSCIGIIWSVGWLIAPGNPNRAEDPSGDSNAISATSPTPPPVLGPLPDLMAMPLIPVGSEETLAPNTRVMEYTDPFTGAIVRRILRPISPSDTIDPLDAITNPLSALTVASSRLQPQSTAQPTTARPVTRIVATANRSRLEASYATATALPQLAPVSVDRLDPSRGEGIFLVLMDYSGDQSLARARSVSEEAFITNIEGEQFVQLASFEQVEYARYMADTLRQQGIPASVSELL